jgi:hypothetical protein
MSLWAVVRSYNDETTEVIGVYSSQELAHQAEALEYGDIHEISLDVLPQPYQPPPPPPPAKPETIAERQQRLELHDRWFADHLRRAGKTEHEVSAALASARVARGETPEYASVMASLGVQVGSRWKLGDFLVTVGGVSPFLVSYSTENPPTPGGFAKWTMPRVQFLNLAQPLP